MEIHWTRSHALDSVQRGAAEQRLRALAASCGEIQDIRITTSETRHHRHGAKQVRIRCAVRGAELVASRERTELGLALNETLDDIERELRRFRERRRESRRWDRAQS